MKSAPLLVELFVEELPPKALNTLGEAFATTLAARLKKEGLAPLDTVVTAYATPRRLAAHLTGVYAVAADKPVGHKLMPVGVGLDASGNPTPALLKKLAALGADASVLPQLRREHDGKTDVLFYDSTARGVTLAEGLQEAIAAALAGLPIPKVMSYQLADGWDTVNFVRPAHGLLALHGAEVVPVGVLGLLSGRTTLGHRFESENKKLVIRDADSYATQLLEEGRVMASFAVRRAEIASQLKIAAAQAGSRLKPIADEALLDEVTALVEFPNVLVGRFEEVFLAVPQECLILTMKANQKYFPLLDAEGKLSNAFLVVSNIAPADPSAVISGNERVVRPRLADAKFFFDQDRKKSLSERVAGLERVVYHNKLGTQGQRTTRVANIAGMIAETLGGGTLRQQAEQAARLAKADLLTDMVGEFPELQGIMGRYYALHDGLPTEVADAIEDHYKPRFAGDSLPRGKVGTVVALADKLETLAGLFGIGQVPTGDKDPFALRRHALGVIRMLAEKNEGMRLSLETLLDAAFACFGDVAGLQTGAAGTLSGFIYERLSGYLRDKGFSAQEVDAVVSQQPAYLDDLEERLHAVRAFAALPESAALAAANKRVGNILKKAAGEVETKLNPSLLAEAAEVALHAALQAVAPKAETAFAQGNFTASLQALAALRGPVDAFFDEVMVNVDDAALRANRLALLSSLHVAMNRVADLSRLSA